MRVQLATTTTKKTTATATAKRTTTMKQLKANIDRWQQSIAAAAAAEVEEEEEAELHADAVHVSDRYFSHIHTYICIHREREKGHI